MPNKPVIGMNELIEDCAKHIYSAMRFDRKEDTPNWVENGNSDAQQLARTIARQILAESSWHKMILAIISIVLSEEKTGALRITRKQFSDLVASLPLKDA